MERFIVISGCSGGGKSTLLAELSQRGFAAIEEPGRRIVAEELARSGRALPWLDPVAFARRAVALALEDRAAASMTPGPVFFDRGLIDAAAALEHATGQPVLQTYAGERYNPCVFLTPPWPAIYRTDSERQHGLDDAIAEYDRLLDAFARLDYVTELLPKVDVGARADIVLERLGLK